MFTLSAGNIQTSVELTNINLQVMSGDASDSSAVANLNGDNSETDRIKKKLTLDEAAAHAPLKKSNGQDDSNRDSPHKTDSETDSSDSSPHIQTVFSDDTSEGSAQSYITNPMRPRALTFDIEDNAELPPTLKEGIPERIRKNYELLLAKTHPDEVSSENRLFTYITPQGLYQYNAEADAFIQILNLPELQELDLGGFIDKIENLSEISEINLNDKIDISQWQALENKISNNKGHTIIGYSINEEVYLRFWGQLFHLYYKIASTLGYEARIYQYPPRIDDGEKIFLNWTQKNWVQDVTMSVRTAGFALLLSTTIATTYFSLFENDPTRTKLNNFYINNSQYFLIGAMLILAMAGFLLCFSNHTKIKVQNRLHRLFLVTESLIGNTRSWTTYATLLLSPLFPQSTVLSIVTYGFIPVAAYAIQQGFKHNALYDSERHINIAMQPKANTFFLALGYATSNSVFMKLGIGPLVNIYYYFKNSEAAYLQETAIIDNIQYAALGIAFITHILRYPLNNSIVQITGRYSTNVLNGLSHTFLDCYAAYEGLYDLLTITLFQTNTPTKKDILYYTFDFFFLGAIYLCALNVSYANTPNLPELSVRPVIEEKGLVNFIYNKTLTLFWLQKRAEPSRDGSIELAALSVPANNA